MNFLPTLLVAIGLIAIGQCEKPHHKTSENNENGEGLLHKLSRGKRQSGYYGCVDYAPINCKQFQRCANGIASTFTCPDGTYFNPNQPGCATDTYNSCGGGYNNYNSGYNTGYNAGYNTGYNNYAPAYPNYNTYNYGYNPYGTSYGSYGSYGCQYADFSSDGGCGFWRCSNGKNDHFDCAPGTCFNRNTYVCDRAY